MTGEESPSSLPRSWLERLTTALLGEPKNRDQLIDLLRDAEHRALLDPDQLAMIEGVLQVSEMRVTEIMVPKTKMVVIQKDLAIEQILEEAINSGHSRFPVIGENRDEVVGILLAKDLLPIAVEYQKTSFSQFNLKELLRPALFIPESKRLDVLLKEFRNNRNHLAIVVDEYGGVVGCVTIEDVLEQIVGEIEDEHDTSENLSIRKYKNNQYSVKAITPIEEFNDYFKTHLSEEEFDTIGGVVMKEFGHLPKRGESISLEGLSFTVLRANRRRILLLRIEKPK
jgi:magnesium and cobalt transporter